MENYVNNNRVEIWGTISGDAEFSHEIYGEKFFIFTMDIPRLSGIYDSIKIMVSERLTSDVPLLSGDRVKIIGQFRSYNSSENGANRLILTVFARDILKDGFDEENPNSIYLNGYICKQPVYRTTPFGREITDMLLAVNIMFKESFLKETCADYAGLKKLLKEYYNFDFTQDFLCVEFKDDKAKKRIEELFFGMLDEGLHKRERYEEIMRCYLDAIINIALRNYKEEHYGKVDVFMEEIISSVEKNCDQPLLLEDLAKKYNYNPRYLSNRLKEYCGLSFKQLLIKKRLDNVIYLMLTTEDSIDTIIRKTGFTNKTYFYSIFEKNYGIKPKFVREYRNNFRNYLELRTQHNDLLTGDVKKVRITKK